VLAGRQVEVEPGRHDEKVHGSGVNDDRVAHCHASPGWKSEIASCPFASLKKQAEKDGS
jgi:hypothetical protein